MKRPVIDPQQALKDTERAFFEATGHGAGAYEPNQVFAAVLQYEIQQARKELGLPARRDENA